MTDKTSTNGTLYLCPTPIGNMGDITLRTIEVLMDADIIACEDTRQTGKLTSKYKIHTTLTSYHEHNKKGKGEKLIDALLSGKNVALVSDAGMPGISDPGADLVKLCIENGIEYTVLPGASAGICALVMSGLDSKRYVFEGFMPKTGRERLQMLNDLAKERRTTVYYEAPHQLLKTLNDIKDAVGCRKMTIIREISKKFEEKIYTDTVSAPALFEERTAKGEYVLVIEGLSPEAEAEKRAAEFEDISISEHVNNYIEQGIDRREAMKMAAKDLGISKREVYAMLLDADS